LSTVQGLFAQTATSSFAVGLFERFLDVSRRPRIPPNKPASRQLWHARHHADATETLGISSSEDEFLGIKTPGALERAFTLSEQKVRPDASASMAEGGDLTILGFRVAALRTFKIHNEALRRRVRYERSLSRCHECAT